MVDNSLENPCFKHVAITLSEVPTSMNFQVVEAFTKKGLARFNLPYIQKSCDLIDCPDLNYTTNVDFKIESWEGTYAGQTISSDNGVHIP